MEWNSNSNKVVLTIEYIVTGRSNNGLYICIFGESIHAFLFAHVEHDALFN